MNLISEVIDEEQASSHRGSKRTSMSYDHDFFEKAPVSKAND